ncbi:NAD-dependent epimerase/dehydratase family protein [Candidatus Mycobacterium wuenschmannii]|uniref:NAD-dependent epimerase/dehydratase family protein n=1 Tax=Candidatus Mycobacterium wuenschmannii TaxID=3027808 RepID=A0ABY8VZN9_9MYCO|nr:NAD-dependent epimerase/dehydratase family protein [Candidatus Mycobacterium wuenschmannii]WIM89115.1 NAD-dependent epimerase/dehydratase family protein [Candidatus Mycobacterium wuenschmannii]
MRIAVTGASGVVGRGVVVRLLSAGHDVVGVGRRQPESWPSQAAFVSADIRDAAAVARALSGAEVVVHCAWSTDPAANGPADRDVNIGGTSNVLDAVDRGGIRRVVFASSAHVYGPDPRVRTEDAALQPNSSFGRDKVRAEEMVAASGVEWVSIRAAAILGRGVDNWVRRALASAVFPDAGRRTLPVVHSDDAHRIFVRAAVDPDLTNGPVNLAAEGELTLGEIADALGRPRAPRLLRAISPAAELDLLLDTPSMDTALLRDTWRVETAWTARDCLHDMALAVRGHLSVGRWSTSLPWRLTHVQDIPAVDIPAADGQATELAGPDGGNGEFDTPIDPRFPMYLATNLSEALPGPFSPSSASATVKGLRASGAVIANRLRPGGLIQREMATRTVGVFAHRLYGAITTAHYMAEVVPFVKPEMVVRQSQFFGPSVASMPIHGEQQLPPESRSAAGPLRTIRNLGVFGVNLAGLIVGADRDTKCFVDDIEWLEASAAGDLSRLSEPRLQSLILLARDHVIDGWVLASGSFMAFAALSTILRALNGRDMVLPVGQELASASLLSAVYRIAETARRDPTVLRILSGPGDHLGELAAQAPEFHQNLLAELAACGHRGPAELEMRSSSYADNPELLLRIVSKALDTPLRSENHAPTIPLRARPVALLAAHQVRDRETRRDRLVRANWLLRKLLRELGRRLVDTGVLETVDDVFYLLVDELDALPADTAALVRRRRADQASLADTVPPAVFSGGWRPTAIAASVLSPGQELTGAGVSAGQVRGRVRIVRPDTIDDLQAGEILVAEVTDVGYTAAFSYAGAVVTELGGPMSHAAVVAREFGIPCVVDVHDATRRLAPGALIEVDGTTGTIRVVDPDLPSVRP